MKHIPFLLFCFLVLLFLAAAYVILFYVLPAPFATLSLSNLAGF